MKRCVDCGATKPLESFRRFHRSMDGLRKSCKACEKSRGAEVKKRTPGWSRHYHLTRKYGIGAAEVDQLIRQQGGLCAICEQEPATQVDHNRSTGEIRGVLCDGCNGGLGALDDDPDLIRRAIAYLRKWR